MPPLSGTLSIARCLYVKEVRLARTRFTLLPHSYSPRAKSFKKATSWMPRHCREFKCRIATDLFPNDSPTSLTSGNGDAARVLARKAPRGWSTGNSLDLTDREDSIVRVAQTIRRADRHPAGNRTVPSINLGRCALGVSDAIRRFAKLPQPLSRSWLPLGV